MYTIIWYAIIYCFLIGGLFGQILQVIGGTFWSDSKHRSEVLFSQFQCICVLFVRFYTYKYIEALL